MVPGQKDDPLAERADALVGAAKLIASEAYMDALEEFSFMHDVRDTEGSIKHWCFILTIAGVFVAITKLRNLNLDKDREQRLTATVAEHLAEWNPKNGLRGFEHCKSFFERTYDALAAEGSEPQFVSPDSIGMWIAWDVLDRPPASEEERRFVRTIGVLVTSSFFDWWDEKL
jgi:hypothetical protein